MSTVRFERTQPPRLPAGALTATDAAGHHFDVVRHGAYEYLQLSGQPTAPMFPLESVIEQWGPVDVTIRNTASDVADRTAAALAAVAEIRRDLSDEPPGVWLSGQLDVIEAALRAQS